MQQGHEVTGMALNRKGETSLDALGVKCRIEYGDILDPVYCERVINAAEAEWVFHLAAVSIVRIAAASPARAIETNIMGTLNILEASKGAKAVVVASSDKAYGDHNGLAYTEDAPLLPTGPYEVSKACADMITRLYGRNGTRAMVTRCANLFGPADFNWSRLIPNACRQAMQGKMPEVHPGSWFHQREWLPVLDACKAYKLIAENGKAGEAYNVGSGVTMRTGEIASLIARQLDAPLPSPREGTSGFYEIGTQILDSSKLGALGWEPDIRSYDALHHTVKWYQEYLCQ